MKTWLVASLVGLNLAFLFLISWRLLATPENHWGLDHRWSLLIWVAEGFALPFVESLTRRERVAILSTSGGCVLAVTLTIYANALLPYELWLARGMPSKWS